MAEKDLSGLFHHTLKDVYFAENAILKALPKMAEAARSEDLKEAFQTHLEQPREQVSRLNRVFDLLGENGVVPPHRSLRVALFGRDGEARHSPLALEHGRRRRRVEAPTLAAEA